jgi:hypothetical protein
MGVNGWVFDGERNLLNEAENDYRYFQDMGDVNIIMYMEAGVEYFIDIAFWDMYEVGFISYEIEYIGKTYDLFRLASPPVFSYLLDDNGDLIYDANGNIVSEMIAGGIDVVLDEDGYYRHDLGKDENGNQIYGSYIYAEFTGITAVISKPIVTQPVYNEDGTVKRDEDGNIVYIKGLIDSGAFNFSINEYDDYVLRYIEQFNGDLEATDAKLREIWNDAYDEYAVIYKLEEIYDAYRGLGNYHGIGEDETEAIRAYVDKIIENGKEDGCVKVDAELARLLQLLMDKYTFKGVDYSWLKLCYYYQYLG